MLWNYPYIKKKKNKITNEIETIAMIDNIFAQLDLFLAQQVWTPNLLLPSSMSPTMVLFP